MADIEIRADNCLAETSAEDTLVAFAVSEDEEDGYVLFQIDGAPGSGPVWLEVSDDIFGAHDAIEKLDIADDHVVVTVKPACVARMGMIRAVDIRPGRRAEGWAEAVALLRRIAAAL